MIKIRKDIIIKSLYLGVFLLFALLIYKDPFSQRTLVSNFEPYPDTFYYINSALNFVKGEGFAVIGENGSIKVRIPPLYSISLVPIFFIKQDPRMAYYINFILAFTSMFFFLMILRKIFINKLIIFSLLILYITNYFIYWMPSLIMAENLTLTLYIATIYFLLSKITKLNMFIVALLAVGSYAAKYANIPITVTIILLFFGKIMFARLTINQKIKQASFLLIFVSGFFMTQGIFEQFTQGNNILSQMFGHLQRIYVSIFHSYASSVETGITGTAYSSSWFGIEYIGKNLPLYLKSITGSPNNFLWDNTPLVPSLVALAGLIGIFTGILQTKFRFISIALLLFVSISIIFMSTFYSFDARYIYIAIPSLIIGLGLFLTLVVDKINLHKRIVTNFLILAFISIYLVSNFTRIKSQISLNLRYAETPWNYISVLKMNEYFTSDKIINNKRPILISALPPFLINYYSNKNYKILPLSYEQEFRGQDIRQVIWGPNDYSDLPKLYKKYLDEGYDVYVSRAGLGNEGYTNRDFNTILKEFDTKLVLSGCYDQCNIYKVKLKETNGK